MTDVEMRDMFIMMNSCVGTKLAFISYFVLLYYTIDLKSDFCTLTSNEAQNMFSILPIYKFHHTGLILIVVRPSRSCN